MSKFTITNEFLIKHIKNSKQEEIRNFEEIINEFINFLEDNFEKEFSIYEKPDKETVKIPVEETYKLFEKMPSDIFNRLEVVINISIYKINLYLKVILNGINDDDFFPYFPNLRALLEHTSVFYKFFNEINKEINKFNSANEILEINKYYGNIMDLSSLFIKMTHNQELNKLSIKNSKVRDFSARESIEYVNKIFPNISILSDYKHLSELSHPSCQSNNYFLNLDNIDYIKIKNMIINKNQPNHRYSLYSKSINRYELNFENIAYTIIDSISLIFDIYEKLKKIKVFSIEIDKIKELFKIVENDKFKEYLESEEYINDLTKTYKKNKYKDNKKINESIKKTLKKKSYEINKTKEKK